MALTLTDLEKVLAERIVKKLTEFGYDNLTVDNLFNEPLINQYAIKILDNVELETAHESIAYAIPTLLAKLKTVKTNE